METENESNDDFIHLMNQLLHTFLYRPITIQKSIQILMAGFKAYLDELDEQRNSAADTAETAPAKKPAPVAMSHRRMLHICQHPRPRVLTSTRPHPVNAMQ